MTDCPDCGVYEILCLENGKRYVGSSVSMDSRWNKHKSNLRRGVHSNPHLMAAWSKYGEEAFVFQIIELTPEDERQDRERFWIDNLNTKNRDYGFNIRDEQSPMKLSAETLARRSATTKGRKHSQEWKDAIRESLNRPEVKAKLAAAARGRKMSDRTKKILAEINTGRPISEEQKEKIRKTLTGRKPEPEALAKLIHMNKTRVRSAEEKQKRVAASVAASSKRYICTDPDGTIHHVTNLNAFCREHELEAKNMAKVASGKRNHTKGWVCQRLSD